MLIKVIGPRYQLPGHKKFSQAALHRVQRDSSQASLSTALSILNLIYLLSRSKSEQQLGMIFSLCISFVICLKFHNVLSVVVTF